MGNGSRRCRAALLMLPEDHVDVLTPPGLYGGGFGAAAGSFGQSDIYGDNSIDEKVQRADGYNSPGWKRLQAKAQSRGLSQPSKARNVVIDMAAVSSFSKGERVFHTKFGYGTIMGIEGDKLDIEFERAGAKKVIGKFVVPADRADDVPF
jgi:DNA helicase-2/ATP-dependent DNA helicase PcrA